MEMTFPHSAVRQDPVTGRIDHQAMIATVIARQANSRTVRALRQAERAHLHSGDDDEQRIHYFAHNRYPEMAVSGAFWKNFNTRPKSESAVYQAGSTNIKDHELEHAVTGEQLNLAGHGASRTL